MARLTLEALERRELLSANLLAERFAPSPPPVHLQLELENTMVSSFSGLHRPGTVEPLEPMSLSRNEQLAMAQPWIDWANSLVAPSVSEVVVSKVADGPGAALSSWSWGVSNA